MLALPGNESVQSINPLVGETNDDYLNDIRGRHVSRDEVFAAIRNAKGGLVEEGTVGAGDRDSGVRIEGRYWSRVPQIGERLYRRRAGANQLWWISKHRRRARRRGTGTAIRAADERAERLGDDHNCH
jgi:hypothetical protein